MIPSSMLLQNWFQQYQLELTRAAPLAGNRNNGKLLTDMNESQKAAPITPIGSPKNCPPALQAAPPLDQSQFYQSIIAELLQARNQTAPLFTPPASQNESLLAETLTHYLAYLVAAQAQNAQTSVPSPQAVSPEVQPCAWPMQQPSNSFLNQTQAVSNAVMKMNQKSKSPDPVSLLPHGIDSILKSDGLHCSQMQPTKDAASSMLESFNALLNIELPKCLVLRTTMPNRSAPFLINGLLHSVANATNLGLQFGVFCNQSVIEHGTRFGPFRGRIRHILSLLSQQRHYISKKLHQFQHQLVQQQALDGDCSLLDGSGAPLGAHSASNYTNWMLFVRCARSLEEANLIAFQNGSNQTSSNSGFSQLEIYYEALVDIQKDTELVVWYGDLFLQLVAKLETLQTNPTANSSDVPDGPTATAERNSTKKQAAKTSSNTAVPAQPESANSLTGESFQCERCGKVFAYKYYRDKHLKFTKCVDQGDRKFPCHLCTRSFEKRDRLRIHILHVHEKHRPHKCLVCGKCFSQSSSLNKHLRVHTGDRPYRCLYCGKAFTASSILRTHVRLHSGERPFKCKYCGKAFASHAAHDSHIRRTHSSGTRTNDAASSSDACKLPNVVEEFSEVEVDDDHCD